jgi:tellurite resistance protein TerC
VTREFAGNDFFTRTPEGWKGTPLILALCAIELSDVAFAIDSVPAALSVSRNLFVVYTSNIFALLGLRALYIALAKTVHELRYLHWGLGAVLAFAAFKMLLSDWVKVSPLLSVAIIVVCIGVSVGFSLHARSRAGNNKRAPEGKRNHGQDHEAHA